MSELTEEGSTIARYIARFRQAQPQAPEERRRTPREEFWWVQTRSDADSGSILSRRSVEEAAISSSVASSSLSSWKTLDQSHEDLDQVESPAPVLPVSAVPVFQENSEVVQMVVEKLKSATSVPVLLAEDDEDAETVIQRVRERLRWHGSTGSRSSMSLASSSIFAAPLAYADVDTIASSLETSAASSFVVEMDGSKPSMEPLIGADLIRNRWLEEEEEEKASSHSSDHEQQTIDSQTCSQEANADEASAKEKSRSDDDADRYESGTEEAKPEGELQASVAASLADTHEVMDLTPSLALSKSPVPLKRSVQHDVQVSRGSTSSSSSSNDTVQQAVTTVDSSGETTAETAQTLDRLVSFVVQSWSKDLFESDDLFETSPVASAQGTSKAETTATEHKDSQANTVNQVLPIVEGAETSQAVVAAVENNNSDVLVANAQDEEATSPLKQDEREDSVEKEQDDDVNEFEDDEVVSMLRQRIALYEEALRRIEQQ